MIKTGIKILQVNELYNMLQHATVYPCLSNPNYLLLLDARDKSDYNESHVLTAKKAPRDETNSYMVPYDAELECKQNIVVYDGNTSEANMTTQSPAIVYAQLLWDMGSRNPVMVLNGGYETFSALYPFLRTQKIIFMPRELDAIKTYPIEILDGFLYVGNWQQGNDPNIQKDLKIQAHINLCMEADTFFKEPGPNLLHIQCEDTNQDNLFDHFQPACDFIDECRANRWPVLVFDHLGISRAPTIVLAYLMQVKECTLEMVYHQVLHQLPNMRPNRAFIQQLSDWERTLGGHFATNIADPNY